jgi:hypothetical protein
MVWRHDGLEELLVQGKGRVAAYSLNGGEPKWWVKGWGFTAVTTPVAGDGMLFVGGSGLGDPSEPTDPIMTWGSLINESGTFAVLRAGDTLDVAGVNKLGESVRAAPAIVGDALYLRSAGHLWAFGESTTRKP